MKKVLGLLGVLDPPPPSHGCNLHSYIEKVSAGRVEVGSCRVKVFPDGSVTSAIIHAGPSAQVRHTVKMSSGTSPEVTVVTMQWITLETNFYAAALASSVHDA